MATRSRHGADPVIGLPGWSLLTGGVVALVVGCVWLGRVDHGRYVCLTPDASVSPGVQVCGVEDDLRAWLRHRGATEVKVINWEQFAKVKGAPKGDPVAICRARAGDGWPFVEEYRRGCDD